MDPALPGAAFEDRSSLLWTNESGPLQLRARTDLKQKTTTTTKVGLRLPNLNTRAPGNCNTFKRQIIRMNRPIERTFTFESQAVVSFTRAMQMCAPRNRSVGEARFTHAVAGGVLTLSTEHLTLTYAPTANDKPTSVVCCGKLVSWPVVGAC